MLWYEKYRPVGLDEYVWTNGATKEQLESWIANPLGYPHLLLAGSTGTGKTTLAKIIRNMLDLESDSKFIPASLRSGVDTIRDEIVGFCEAGGFRDIKLIIMDEADRLSRDAQEMMRNVMDRYNEDVRFIFTCNHPEKISDAVKGRMWVVPIEKLDEADFTDRLVDILVAENIEFSSDASVERLSEIVRVNYPNLRHAISDLQWSSSGGVLTEPEDEVHQAYWETAMLDLILEFDVGGARSLVASMRPDEFEHAYRILYENSELFGKEEDEAILIIAEYLHRHSQAGLPDITLCACLIKLAELEI